jgi:hypothetical protein
MLLWAGNLTGGREATNFRACPDRMLQAASLEALPNIRHAFFTRPAG